MSKNKTAKRSFGYNTTALATVKPMLEPAVYAGVMTGAAVVGKENKQYINLVKETKWDKDAWNEAKGKNGMFVETGEWVIEGSIFYGVTLTSKKAIQTLQQDEPRVFGGRIVLKFNSESLSLDAENNIPYANFLIALGLDEIDFSESVDFEYNENIEVPEELAGVDRIVDKLNSINYQRAIFDLVCQSANNQPCKVKVLKQASYRDKTQMENTIDTGSYNSFCGILKYEDGSENDVEDMAA